MRTYISAYKQFRYYEWMKVYGYTEGMMTKCDFCTESNEKGSVIGNTRVVKENIVKRQ